MYDEFCLLSKHQLEGRTPSSTGGLEFGSRMLPIIISNNLAWPTGESEEGRRPEGEGRGAKRGTGC